MVDPLESLDAIDGDRVRADAYDPRAHLHEGDSELLHVRLACGISDHGAALGEYGGHECVLGGGDRGLVEQDLRASKASRVHPVPAARDVELGAESAER